MMTLPQRISNFSSGLAISEPFSLKEIWRTLALTSRIFLRFPSWNPLALLRFSDWCTLASEACHKLKRWYCREMFFFPTHCWRLTPIYYLWRAALNGRAETETFPDCTCQVNGRHEERFYLFTFPSNSFELVSFLVTTISCPTEHSAW